MEALDRRRDKGEYDIYLLDIELATGSGFEYAKKIRQLNKRSKIAFLTSHPEYSIPAYELDVSGYLVKPFSTESLIRLVERLHTSIEQPITPLCIVENYRSLSIPICEIEFITKGKRKTVIYTIYDQFETNESIQSIVKDLPEGAFHYLNRSTLVHLNHITRFDSEKPKYRMFFKKNSLLIQPNEFKQINQVLRCMDRLL